MLTQRKLKNCPQASQNVKHTKKTAVKENRTTKNIPFSTMSSDTCYFKTNTVLCI